MSNQDPGAKVMLSRLLDFVNKNTTTPLRLKGWDKKICWTINDDKYYWEVKDQKLVPTDCQPVDLTLCCSLDTLSRIVQGSIPLFIAIWVTGDIQFEGSYSDVYKLGYLFLRDERKRKVVFLTHCFLNINTRFPQGCAFAGANVPLITRLLKYDLGIVQMPCPEFLCLGLEKEHYGRIPADQLRACFREIASGVADQIKAYHEHGYRIAGIIGMNPSPSCGVEVSKGKGTILGTNQDTAEIKEPGVFIEELVAFLNAYGLAEIPLFGIRRLLPGEGGIDDRLKLLEEKLVL